LVQIKYSQEFIFKSKYKTSVENLVYDPFGSLYEGKKDYLSALQRLGGTFENLTAAGNIIAITRFLTKMPTTSQCPSLFSSTSPSFLPSPSPTLLRVTFLIHPDFDLQTMSWEETENEPGFELDYGVSYAESDESDGKIWFAKGLKSAYADRVDIWRGETLFQRLLNNGDDLWLGHRVALLSDSLTIAVGSPSSYTTGIVEIYHRVDTDTSFREKHVSPGNEAYYQTLSGNDFFGNSIALSSDALTIAIGAPGLLKVNGRVEVYYRANQTSLFEMVKILHGNEAARFGYILDMTKNGLFLVAVAPSAYEYVASGKGSLHFFERHQKTEQFDEVEVVRGNNLGASLGYYGVAIVADSAALYVHASTDIACNFCTILIKSYEVNCTFSNPNHTCSEFDEYPALTCE